MTTEKKCWKKVCFTRALYTIVGIRRLLKRLETRFSIIEKKAAQYIQ